MNKTHILFVCTGNICRSPLAQGIFSNLVVQAGMEGSFEIDSAGTHAAFAGNPPDVYAQNIASMHGIDISHFRSRRITKEDYKNFDLLLAADNHNLHFMLNDSIEKYRTKIQLLMHYVPEFTTYDIPDPYGNGIQGFREIYEMIDQACAGLFSKLKG